MDIPPGAVESVEHVLIALLQVIQVVIIRRMRSSHRKPRPHKRPLAAPPANDK